MNTLHFANIVHTQAAKFGEKKILFDRTELTDPWQSLSWNELALKVDKAAKAFLFLNVNEQSHIGQFSQNKMSNFIVDFALFSIRCVNVPIYPTSSFEQLKYIVDDARLEYLFVGKEQYEIALKLFENKTSVKRIIVFDNSTLILDKEKSMYFDDFLKLGESNSQSENLNKLRDLADDADMASILYTSGTTGNPKGVIMTHEMYNEAMKVHAARLNYITPEDISLAFLPLTHVFERTWSYFLFYIGAVIYINHRPTEIQQTIKDVRPTLMCAVPRFWEKVFIGVHDNLEKSSPQRLGIIAWALAVGKRYNMDYLRIGRKPDIFLSIKYKIAEKLILSKVKDAIGLDKAKTLPVAGAKLSDNIATFFLSIGVPIVYGYGLTESTATVSHFLMHDYKIGTVGTLMPNLEIKIADDNEILLKGKTITPGYYNNDEATKAAFTEDGWFKTGDAGSVSEDKKLSLTERIKDLFKTSNGKYIAPQEIETRLDLDKYIEQSVVIGDQRNFVTALIVPSVPELEKFAKDKNLEYNDTDELFKLPEIYSLIEERIQTRQEGMAHFEMIKKFILIKKGFTIETGELTNTLKLRRTVIMQKYKEVIDSMYEKTFFVI